MKHCVVSDKVIMITLKCKQVISERCTSVVLFLHNGKHVYSIVSEVAKGTRIYYMYIVNQ